jgi:ribosomal protein S18 acetylase RimI-like enzyme
VAPGVRAGPARGGNAELLLELTAGLRKALLARGERLPTTWPDEVTADLRSGALEGVLLHSPGLAPSIGILSLQRKRAFAQVHVGEGPEPRASAEATMLALVERLPTGFARLDIGVTGLSPADEEELGRALSHGRGFVIIRRFGLERTLSPPDAPAYTPLPEGLRFRPVRERTIEELGRLDWEAFRAGPDAAFVSDTAEGDAQLLRGILDGQLGRFLDEASALLEREEQVVGFVLTVEESPQVGVVVDLAVDPNVRRHGAGRALLTRALRALVALGYTRARLWVTEANAAARTLYASLGFEPSSTALLYSWRAGAPSGAEPSPH